MNLMEKTDFEKFKCMLNELNVGYHVLDMNEDGYSFFHKYDKDRERFVGINIDNASDISILFHQDGTFYSFTHIG